MPKKYKVDIEGHIHDWHEDSITVPQLRELAGYPADQQMIVVDLKDNSERVLDEDEAIKIRPGTGFAKKVSFRRG